LLVRADFGDIPQWLDEGIASLYEVSGRKEDEYFGLPNWRGDVLQGLWQERPTVRDLIGTEWFSFDDPRVQPQGLVLVSRYEDGIDPDPSRPRGNTAAARRNAVTMAMARYFLLYLDRRGELAPVFHAVRDRGFAELDGDARAHTLELVESTLGRSVDALNAEFSAWFQSGELDSVRRIVDSGGPVYVATADVNVRTGPGIDFQKLALLSTGQHAAVFGETDSWYEVHFDDGSVGYVADAYLTRQAR